MENKMFQHGDVILIPMGDDEQIPEDAKVMSNEVVMEGELTGHAHRMPPAIGALVLGLAGAKFLKTPQEVPLTHEEHGTFTIPAGNYRVHRVQEYNPYNDMVQSVQD